MNSIFFALAACAVIPNFSVAQDCVAPPPNLIACWDADGFFPDGNGLMLALEAFEPVARPPLTPASYGGPVPGKVGNAFSFANGTGLTLFGYPLTQFPELNVTAQVSVEMWVRVDNAPVWAKLPLAHKDGAVGTGFGLYLNANTGQALLEIGHGAVASAFGGPDLRDGQFHHVAGTYDATDGLRVYADGVLVASAPGAGPMVTNPSSFQVGSSNVFTGLIDEVSLYNRALTSGEIAAIASAADGKCKEPWPQRRLPSGTLSTTCTSGADCASFTGHTISIDGDRMVVGAYNGLRVYDRVGGDWSQSDEVVFPAGTPWNGASAALSGDFIGLCQWTPVPSSTSISYGAFYQFDGTNWIGPLHNFQQRATTCVAADGDTFVMLGREAGSLNHEFRIWRMGSGTPTLEHAQFGRYFNAAISGNLLALGNWATNGTGEVHVFQRSGTSWSLLHTISPNGYETILPTAGLHFGWSVALEGQRLLVTAAAEGAVGQVGGVAYVFDLSSGGVVLENGGRLTPSRPARRFGMVGTDLSSLELGLNGWVIGTGCALKGDLVVIGAPADADSIVGWTALHGSALAFAKQNGVWGEVSKLLVPPSVNNHYVGMSVGITDDRQVIVGVPGLGAGITAGGIAWFDDFQHAHLPTSYCTSSTTTNGCSPSMSSVGSPSLSNQRGFYLRASDVEGQKQGLLFYGISGRRAAVWAPGSTSLACVKAPVQRTPNQNSGGTAGSCDGAFSVEWNTYLATHPGALGQPLAAGALIDAQAWFRDPAAPKSTNLSNGLEFMILP